MTGFALLAASALEILALVDSLDFASVADIERAEGNIRTFEHVLGTYPTGVLWRDRSGGKVRYASVAERSAYCENPLDKRAFPRYGVYGDLRQDLLCTNAFDIVREECERRGVDFGIHSGWEDSHSGCPWTESNWVMAHPQFSTRVRHGPVRLVSASVGYSEVLEHKMQLVNERLAFRPKKILLDMRRRGGWGPACEYVEPIMAEWRRRYECDPPASWRDERWISLVSEYATDYVGKYAARCHESGTELLLCMTDFGVNDTNFWVDCAMDWRQLATNSVVDGIVLMGVACDATNALASTEAVLRYAKENCGPAKLYFHANMYDNPNGVPYYARQEGLTAPEAARRLLEMAERTGCAGVILTCVDYNNYPPAVCEAIAEHSIKTGGRLVRWTGPADGLWSADANWATAHAPDAATNVVEFRSSAKLKIDRAGVTDVARLLVRGFSSSVTLAATTNAMLRFTAPATAATASDVGICVDDGSSLTVEVPIEAMGKFAVTGYGDVCLKGGLVADELTLGPGTVTLDGGTLAVGRLNALGDGHLTVANGTVVVPADCAWNDLHCEVESGASVTLVATNAVTITLPEGFVWPDEVTIGTNVTVRIGSTISTWARSAVPPKINIRAGGRLHLTDFTSYVNTPIDLTIDEGGQIYDAARVGVVAHSLVLAGVTNAPGYHSATESENAAIRGLSSGAAVIVPVTWSGRGDGVTWHDPANWESGRVPDALTSEPVDFSYATTASVSLTQDVATVCFSYLPATTNTLTICGASGGATFEVRGARQYAPAACVSEGSRVVFDVDVENMNKGMFNVINGHGAVRFRRILKPDAPMSHTSFWLIPDGAVEIAGRLDLRNLCPARNGYVDSEIVFLDGADVNIMNVLCANFSGYTNLERLRQEGGSVRANSLYVMTYRTSDLRMRYTLNGGTLALSEGVYLGAKNPCFTGNPIPGGEFVMTGGELDTPLLSTELNSNWYRLSGGAVRLGTNGIVRGTATLAKAVTNDSPGLVFGGVTFLATNSWTSAAGLDIELTGENGPTVFDVAEGETVTLAGPISGTGGIVKRGLGTLRFGQYAAAGTIVVEKGRLAISSGDDMSGATVRAWSREALVVEDGETVRVGRLYLKDIPKYVRTYAVSGGALEVLEHEEIPLSIGEAANAPTLDWFTEGTNAVWWAEWDECAFDGRHAVRSGAAGHGDSTTLGVRFAGKGTFSFVWRASTEPMYDAVRLEADGETFCPLSGETGWQRVSLDLNYGDHVIRWTYQKNRSVNGGEDAVWVDGVSWTTVPEPTLAEALNRDCDLVWTTGGEVAWEAVRTLAAYEGRACAISGLIGDLEKCWLETTVDGAGHLDFQWAVSCEEGYDWYEFSVDGEIVRSLSGLKDWAQVSLDLGEGEHVLRWTYWKDELTDPDLAGADCALLDYVSWVPEHEYISTDFGSLELTAFYAWLRENRCVTNSSAARQAQKAQATALACAAGPKGVSLASEYVAGTDPNDSNSVFSATILMTNGVPHVDWTPARTDRRYRIWASDDLVNWIETGSAALTGRFFKVTVEMP